MIKFVVYEDEKVFRNNIKTVIKDVMKQNDKEYIVKEFDKFDDKLKQEITSKTPAIYILDIEVPDSISGIDLARKIRKQDWNSIILMVTSHADLGYEALKAQIMLLDFISKYNDYKISMERALNKAISKLDNKKVLIFESNNITYKIYTDDILYIVKDTVDRKIIIKTEYNQIVINETLINIEKMLDKRFFKSHRSCLVNVDKIVKIDWKDNLIYFTNGEVIDYISKYKKKGLKEYVSSF